MDFINISDESKLIKKKRKNSSKEKKKLKKIVEHIPDLSQRARRSVGLSTVQMDQAQGSLGIQWKGLILAGEQSDDVEIETEGERSCGAEATLNDGEVIEGFFDSLDCHAEMDVLQNVISAGYTLADIDLIEIEKQPCPRCAVVLNKLHLNNKVRYKNVGQKDYPTWRYPKLRRGHNWAVTMGVSAFATKDTQQNTLLDYFRFNKWW